MSRVALRSLARPVTVAVLCTGLLGACQATSRPNETVGTLGGAALGGFVGSQFGGSAGWKAAATGLGVLVGAALGNQAGQALDERDRHYMQQAQSQAYGAPVGQTITWQNPGSGHSGTFTPLRDGYTNTGSYCRQFHTTVTIDGRLEEATGTACRNASGEWEIINSRG